MNPETAPETDSPLPEAKARTITTAGSYCSTAVPQSSPTPTATNQPSWVSRTLLPLATFTNNPTIDTAQLLADSLWVSIAENSSPGLPRSSPSTYRRSTSSGRGRLISFEGRQLYISNAGRTFDTSQPPPYNCYRCGGTHWAIHCTAQNSSPAGGSGSNLSGSFSARSNTPNF